MGWVFVLILIVILTLALVLVRRGMSHEAPRTMRSTPPSSLDPYFEANFPLVEAPEDYLQSKFAYRYKDSFVYDAGNHFYKVYPLCCDTCKASAHREINKQKTLASVPGLARVHSIERYPEPPRNQGQARDEISYIVFKLEKATLFPNVKNLTIQDLKDLMETSLQVARTLGEKIKDMSVANVSRLASGRLGFQHLDDTSPVGAGELTAKPDGTRESFNLFYNRYNVLKHIPAEVFASANMFNAYRAMLDLIRESTNHERDFATFMTALSA